MENPAIQENNNQKTNHAVLSAQLQRVYFLTQILQAKVFWQGKKIGRLMDVVIADNDKLAEVTHLVVARPFGDGPLYIPLSKVKTMDARKIFVEAGDIKNFEGVPQQEPVLLKDHILDKKVLDTEDHEVDVVYDVKMSLLNNHLFVTDVDMSKYGLLRRMGLKWLGDIIYQPKQRPNKEIIPWTYIQPLPSNLGSFEGAVKLKVLKECLHDIDPVDLADIIEQLDPGQREAVFGELSLEHASDTLEEIDPNVQRQLVASLRKERAAQLINEMTPAQAADVLSALPADEAEDLLALLDKKDFEKVQSILKKQEARILDFATSDFIQFGPEITVAQVEEQFAPISKGKDVISYIYVTDPEGKLLGVANLKDLLLADDDLLLKDIMDTNVISLNPGSSLKETSRMFHHYNFQALPITDPAGKILGVIPYRDIMNLKHKFLE
jgi:CBS domain-containing protein/sporulation protein YlmC with PRC-barrel domain